MENNIENFDNEFDDLSEEESLAETVINTAVLANSHDVLFSEKVPQFVAGILTIIATLEMHELLDANQAAAIRGQVNSPLFAKETCISVIDEQIAIMEDFDPVEGAFEDLFAELDDSPELDESLLEH